MSEGKITPNKILHFNKKTKQEENEDSNIITTENILEKSSSDNVSDAMKNLYGKHGLLKEVKAINPEHKVAGFVKTVETNSNDWGTSIKGIYSCEGGEILVIKCSDDEYAVWGGLASKAAKKQGVKATIIIGSSRDTEDVLEMNYPIFSKKIMSRAGLPLNKGTVGEKLLVDDMIIETGDFAVCDLDGVVIIPKDNIDEVITEVNNIKNFENDCIKKMSENNQRLDKIIGF